MLRKYKLPIKNYFRYSNIDFDPVTYLTMDDRKAAFLVMSKVACTSIKATIGKSYGIDFEKDSGLDIHTHSGWHMERGKLKPPVSDYYLFTFVRNPFARLVSCYKDRVLFKGKNEDFDEFYFKHYPIAIRPNIPFPEFVRIIADIPDYLADRHFKKQSYSINRQGRKIRPDFIGRFENLKEDWAFVANKLGLPPELENLNPSSRHTGAPKEDYKSYYDRETLALAYGKYKEDVELFGYQDEYATLLGFVENNQDKAVA